jgi:predicted nuclease with RNAse H fold
VHVVALEGRRVVAGDVFAAQDVDAVVAWVGDGVRRVAIDAPSALSVLAHAEDDSLAPKFRAARCGEIALGRDAGIWVPWVSPCEGGEVAPWIAVGLSLFAAFAAAGIEAVETYPHGVFRRLAGGRVPPKSSAEGRAQRVGLLRAAGVREQTLPLWDHDGLDALAAALVAADPSAEALTCGHDGSAVWLPAHPVS